VTFLRENKWLLAGGCAFISLLAYFVWIDSFLGYAIPFGLLMIYSAVFYTQFTFFLIIACTPLSVNIEEYTQSFGLFIPTEPLLFGTMILLLFQGMRSKIFPDYLKLSPLYWAILVYLIWLIFTAITSTDPAASFKFILARCWFIVPMLFYGSGIMNTRRNIYLFLWLFCSAMIVAILYTIFVHAMYGFGEKESHWVMWPFFKDHTIYGAIVALVIPLIFGLLLARKHSPLMVFILYAYLLIAFVGLYFSYTRAAQLSLVLSFCIYLLIRFKIKFSWIASAAIVVGIGIWFSWDAIQQDLERNKYEHTTEDIGERFQSAANVTTDASNLERINRWSCAIEMFKERPLTGFGPGTYAFEYARFQEPENLTIISTNFGTLGNAHSEYLGPLAETGLPGLLTVLAIIVCIFYLGIDLYNKWPAEDKEIRTIIMAMIVALSTYFIHAFLNNYLDTDKAAVPVWVMCATFIGLRHKLKQNDIELQ